MKIDKDIKKASSLVTNLNNHMFEKIYPFATENLKGSLSEYDFTGKDILTVLGSSSQAMDMILKESNKIDTFDINPLTIYYFYLVKSFIKSGISSKEYINLFNSDSTYSDQIYKKLSDNMDENYKIFWDTLYSRYGNILFKTGRLFHRIEKNKDNIIKHCSFLEEDNIDKLRDKNIEIGFQNKDLFDIKLDNNYDMIYLSNIMQYSEDMFYDTEINSLKKYKEIINKLSNNLNINGQIYCGYFYYFTQEGNLKMCFKKTNMKKIFNENNYSYITFDPFDDIYYHGKDAVLVYKK